MPGRDAFGTTRLRMAMRISVPGVIVTVAVTIAFASIASAAPNPSEFSARVDNPWFPLKPGTVLTYRGVKDGEPSREVLTVTHRTKRIDGVPVVVVSDKLYLRGRLEERTTDCFGRSSTRVKPRITSRCSRCTPQSGCRMGRPGTCC